MNKEGFHSLLSPHNDTPCICDIFRSPCICTNVPSLLASSSSDLFIRISTSKQYDLITYTLYPYRKGSPDILRPLRVPTLSEPRCVDTSFLKDVTYELQQEIIRGIILRPRLQTMRGKD